MMILFHRHAFAGHLQIPPASASFAPPDAIADMGDFELPLTDGVRTGRSGASCSAARARREKKNGGGHGLPARSISSSKTRHPLETEASNVPCLGASSSFRRHRCSGRSVAW
jgi:hypothetical protein